jgi:hypothetical protein
MGMIHSGGLIWGQWGQAITRNFGRLLGGIYGQFAIITKTDSESIKSLAADPDSHRPHCRFRHPSFVIDTDAYWENSRSNTRCIDLCQIF